VGSFRSVAESLGCCVFSFSVQSGVLMTYFLPSFLCCLFVFHHLSVRRPFSPGHNMTKISTLFSQYSFSSHSFDASLVSGVHDVINW
jgi:hypothetical protein